MDNKKFEQLIDMIINEEEDKARALFHEIVVEKSREIYESLIDEEDLEENLGHDDVEEFVDEVTSEDDEMSEDADMGDEEGEESFGDEESSEEDMFESEEDEEDDED